MRRALQIIHNSFKQLAEGVDREARYDMAMLQSGGPPPGSHSIGVALDKVMPPCSTLLQRSRMFACLKLLSYRCVCL